MYAQATSPGLRPGGGYFQALKDTVTNDERLHQADATMRFPAPLSTENSESEAAQFEGAWDAASINARKSHWASKPPSIDYAWRCILNPQPQSGHRQPQIQLLCELKEILRRHYADHCFV